MAKYLGNTGLSRLWSKYKSDRYNLKTNELSGSNPDTTYTYTETTESPIPITVTILTTHVSSSQDRLSCTLSQAIDVNLVFELSGFSNSSWKRRFVILAGNTSATFLDSPITGVSVSYANSVTIVNQSTLSSKYTFTINTQLNVGSQYEHVVSVEDAQVDWHTQTISGTLTRTTQATTKPQINTYIGVAKYDQGAITYYRTYSQYSIATSSNTASLSNASLFQTTALTISSPIIPVDATIATTTGHYVTTAGRTYTSLPANIDINVTGWSQTNLRPTLHWYRSTGDCVYEGTLPTATMTFTNIVAGDQIFIKLCVFYDPDDPDSGWPYTYFTCNKTFSSSAQLTQQTINFHDSINSYSGIDSNDNAYTYRIYMDAYLTNPSRNISSQYIGSWPSGNISSVTGYFSKVFTCPSSSTRPVSSNTTLFGRVHLDGSLW